MKLPKIQEAQVSGKTVFLRLDLDVYLENGQISDDSRLVSTYPTVELLLQSGAKIVIAGHLARPHGYDQHLSLAPIANWYANKLNVQILNTKIGEFEGWKLGENITLLENLRFYPEEENNDPDFAQKIATLSQVYVNDAFAASHRNHASITKVAKLLPHFAGLQLQKEVEELSKILENPTRPLVVIIGGEKLETKLPLVEKMLLVADHVLVGGEIASEITKVENPNPKLLVADQKEGGEDITEESVEKFREIIKTAGMIVWNGPMGVIQKPETQTTTIELAKAIIQTQAHTIVGGGNTVGFLKQIGLLDKFSFVSTGGGAMLSFLAGEKLPGLEALNI